MINNNVQTEPRKVDIILKGHRYKSNRQGVQLMATLSIDLSVHYFLIWSPDCLKMVKKAHHNSPKDKITLLVFSLTVKTPQTLKILILIY